MKSSNPIQALVFHSHGVGQILRLPAFPKKGETIWTSSWEIGNDGAKGSNVAVALSNLGITTAFAGKVGTDIWGEIGLDWLNRSDVDLSCLIHDPQMPSMIGMVLIDDKGENSILLGGASAHFTEQEIRTAIHAFPSADFLITGFEIHIPDALKIARYGKQCKKYVILNPSPTPTFDIGPLPWVDLLILNQPESEALLTLQGVRTIGTPREQLLQLHKQYLCPNIILTLGGEGSLLLEQEKISFFPSKKVSVVDTSGAGDSFLAAVAACLIRGSSLSNAFRFAAVYASYTVQKRGTFPAFASRQYILEHEPAYAGCL